MSVITDPIYEPAKFEPDQRSVFGPIVSAFEVEHALARVFGKWTRDYLAEIERQRGLQVGRLPTFRSITVAGQPEKWPEDQLPALLVASPGLDVPGNRMEVRSDDAYVGRFRLECVCEVSVRGNRQAIMLARLYAAAVMAMLVQRGGVRTMMEALEPARLRRVELLGSRYDIRDWTVDRTRCAGSVEVIVEVADMVHRAPWGPAEPRFAPTPPAEDPEPMLLGDVESRHVIVTKEEEE